MKEPPQSETDCGGSQVSRFFLSSIVNIIEYSAIYHNGVKLPAFCFIEGKGKPSASIIIYICYDKSMGIVIAVVSAVDFTYDIVYAGLSLTIP